MTPGIKKHQTIEQNLSRDRGPFLLYALFLREESPDRWDLVLSAPWAEGNRQEALDYVTARLYQTLKSEEVIHLSHIEVIDVNDPDVRLIATEHPVEHGQIQVRNVSYFNQPIRHGILVTAQLPHHLVKRKRAEVA